MRNVILFLIIGVLSGCSDWLDVNKDPNTPEEVPSRLILPATEASIATRVGGNMFNFGGFFVQYWTQSPEANQYNKVDNYDITAPFLDHDYTELFAGALNDLETIRNQATAEGDNGNYLVATVLRAYTFQIWVDLIDDVPFLEAFQGLDNKFPHYDDGQTIYESLISEIDQAISNIDDLSYIDEESDYLFGSYATENELDLVDVWIAFANTVKLKLYMRASYAVDYSTQIKALIDRDNFIEIDAAVSAFANEPNRYNPWYGTNSIGLGTVNNIAALPIVSYMESKDDPRLAVLWKKVNDKYVAGVPYVKEGKTASYSAPLIAADKPVYLFTLSELELFKSEAYIRFYNDDTKAKEAYEKAIDNNLALHGLSSSGSDLYGSGAPYEWNSSAQDKLEQIGMQKWVSLCLVNNMEAWCEMRRMDYPSYSDMIASEVYDDEASYLPGTIISPNGNTLGAHNFIKRLPYPEASTRLNTNAPDQKALTVPVWWDVVH